jgi:hypothetical protein
MSGHGELRLKARLSPAASAMLGDLCMERALPLDVSSEVEP